ncbi:2'-5' RNA ligase [Vulcanisaeta moutnovskia 768-28]|uniref:RNA 2',3'-cyclic phosphodiesterase n=1 Tax=Vulcanisaeta moutnovskia (strain 768-28) TaxID=985053 RepID=F0QU25_VULM7|nr:RNA 2',3'-cyclic phosphodiesterase [Vulcanisaeta moutnovskia]ADY01811.1 2'-5' RNA ligase [Vulcanisaeta moutnovskia 768-28]
MSKEIYRVFIAVDLTDQLKEPIIRMQKELMSTGVDMKPVEPENMHITLRFIGEIGRDLVEEVKKRLSSIKYNQFTMHVRGVGAFPNIERPRVIWVGIEEGARDLMNLHELLMKFTGDIGERDERGFVPHLTIARVKYVRNRDRYMEVIRKYENMDFGTQLVDSIKLKRSILTPKGPIYSDLMTIKLS